MRKTLALAVAACAVVAVGAAAGPASACTLVNGVDPCTGSTTVALNAGTIAGVLSITTSPAATLTSLSTSATGTLGTTTIADLRGDATPTTPSGWTYTVKSSDFTLFGATTPGTGQTITADKVKVYLTTLPVPNILGTVTYSSPPSTPLSALTLNADHTPTTVLTAVTYNLNTTTFVPQLLVDTTGKTAGLYTGSVTQSVS